MFNLNKGKTQVIIVVLLLFLVIGVAFYALIYKPGTTSTDNLLSTLNSEKFPITPPVSSPANPIVLNQTEGIKFGNQTLSIFNGWSLDSGYLGKKVDNISCSNATSDCPIYKVTKNGISFYISPKAIQAVYDNPETLNYKSDLSLTTTAGIKVFNYLNTNIYAPASTSNTTTDANNPGVEIVVYKLEQFGCINSNLCVTTGALPLGQEENKLYLDSFNDLLLSITTN